MKVRSIVIALVCLAAAACARVEMEPENVVVPGFKRVTVDANVPGTRSTVADDGTFSWSAGDVISVLATDGNFYDFTLESGTSFTGTIPETAEVTTVAAYPSVAENGTNGGVYADGKLNFTLKGEIDALEGCSNIPMVASFEQGAESFDFKQVGAAFKFHVDGAPADFFAEVTFEGTNPTGTFAIDPSKAGTVALEGASSEAPVAVTAHYVSESAPVDGATFYIPVAVGTYTSMHVKLYEKVDGEASVFYDADRVRESGDYSVSRGDIFIMKPIAVSIPMRITQVTPYFSDAKVEFAANPAATNGYAIYVDENAPIIVDTTVYHIGAPYTSEGALDNEDNSPSGTLLMGSTHTVAVAPIDANDNPIDDLKSEEKTFTLGTIEQYLGDNTNQGPHQFTIWMKAPTFQPRTTYAAVEDIFKPSIAAGIDPSTASTVAKDRVYRVQVFDTNDPTATPVYCLYTVDIQTVASGSFGSSSWIGKLNGSNVWPPERLTFGNLDPGTTYYFRARCIAPVKGLPAYGGGTTINISSATGESAWSEMLPVATQPAHVASDNEVLWQGFDDLAFSADFVNSAAGLVPYLNITGSDKKNFQNKAATVLTVSPSEWTGEWTFNTFNTTNTSTQWGIYEAVDGEKVYNAKAGSLQGWVERDPKAGKRVYPGYGFLRVGNNTTQEEVGFESPALTSDKLTAAEQICRVTLHLCPLSTDAKRVAQTIRVDYLVPAGDGSFRVVAGKDMSVNPNRYPMVADDNDFDSSNYFTEYAFQEVTAQVKLATGYKIRVVTAPTIATKRIAIGDVLVELAPDVTDDTYTGSTSVADNNSKVSVPDATNYDVFGLGEFPLSYWYGPEWALVEQDIANGTMTAYQRVKDAGFNVVSPTGAYAGISNAERNLQILEWCAALDMKFMGCVDGGGWGQRIERQNECFAQIDQYITHPNYVGQYCGDEPHGTTFEGYTVWHQAWYDRYHASYPDKFIYVNLFPYYANYGQLGFPNYEAYLNAWLQMPHITTVSFDNYPLTKDKGVIGPHYYLNLDMVRSKTLARKMHFWMIGESGSQTYTSREKDLRWEAWVAIAMGSKGYQYFCYEYPREFGEDDTIYMIDLNGNPTNRYPWIQQLNADIKPIGKKLLQCHADGGIMVPYGAYTMYEPRTSYAALTEVTGAASITGCFRGQDGSYKVLVTHLQPEEGDDIPTYSVTLHFDGSVTTVSTLDSKTGTYTASVPVDSENKVTVSFEEGQAVLVEWN